MYADEVRLAAAKSRIRSRYGRSKRTPHVVDGKLNRQPGTVPNATLESELNVDVAKRRMKNKPVNANWVRDLH